MTTPVLRGSTAPLPGRPDGTPYGQNTLQATSPDATLVGDLVLCVSWHGTPSATGSLLTLRSGEGWTQLFNYFHDDGTSDGAFAVAWKIATLAGAQVYQAFNTTSPATDCRTALRIYSVGTFDSSGILSATPVSFTDGNVAPDPGNVSGLNAARDYLIEAIGGWWHNQDLVVCTPGAPSGYGNLIDTSAGGWLELALANKAVSGVTSENPGVFTDNVSSTNNNGSVGGTIAILGAAGIARQAIVTQAELEVPEAPPQRRTIVTQTELEVPNKKLPDTLTFYFHRHWARYRVQSEDPQPETTRRAILTQAEFEVPELGRRGIISHVEMEVPFLTSNGVGIGFFRSRPPQDVEPPWVVWNGSNRTPDFNSDYNGPQSSNGTNGNWSWLTNPGTNYAWSSTYGAWLASRPNRRFLLNLGLCSWIGGLGGNPGALLGEVAAGTHNSKFEQCANYFSSAGIATPGRVVYVNLAWEMNGNWFAWGLSTLSGTPPTTITNNFKGAWQQAVTSIRNAQPSVNWKFCLCPNQDAWDSQAFVNAIWPGDSFVDLVGVNIYDTFVGYPPANDTTRQAAWDNFHAPRLANLAAFASAHGKSMMSGEWGTGRRIDNGIEVGGGDNSIFINKFYQWATTNNVEILTHFDYNPGSGSEWYSLSVQVFPQPNAAAAFKATFPTLPHPW